MNRILEIVLNKKMSIIRVGVAALALVVFAAQVLLATQPASAREAVAGTASGEAFSTRYYDARDEYNKAQAATASDLEVKRASECVAVMANKEAFSARSPDAKTEYCKALAATNLVVKRASECVAVAATASKEAFSARYPDARTEYCKALASRLLLRPISPSTLGNSTPVGSSPTSEGAP